MMRKAMMAVAAMAALAALAGPAGAQQATGEAIQLAGFTGQVLVTMPDGTQVRLEAGMEAPVIPPGATVEVISGEAALEVFGVRITLAAGSAVKVSSVNERRGSFVVETVKGENRLLVGTAEARMGEGDIVMVLSREDRAFLRVLAGSVPVTDEERTLTLERGQSLMVRLTRPPLLVPPAPEPPEPQPVEASPFIPN